MTQLAGLDVGRRSWPAALGVAAALGLFTGTATSLLQGVLPVPWVALVNAASPWLAVAFVAGALAGRQGTAAAAGALTCAGEVAGYYLTSASRGHPAGASAIAFWLIAGVVAGPLAAEVGQLWQRGGRAARVATTGALGGSFVAEGVRYQVVLGYGSRALLFIVLGVTVAVLGGMTGAVSGRRRSWSR